MKNVKIEIPQGYQIDEEKSTFTNIVFKPIEKKWVDLGLPSRTLWCDTNEEGYYLWDEMMNKFDEENLPKLTDFAELYDYCVWKWDDKKKGMIVTGPNGNNIFIPALGYCSINNKDIYNVDNDGYYWSATPTTNNTNVYGLTCTNLGSVYPSDFYNRTSNLSVRCIKRIK